MTKKASTASLTLLAVGLASAMALHAPAQKPAAAALQQSPQVTADSELLRKYHDVSALGLPGRRDFFRTASAEDKSDLWRVHLAIFLARRPELNGQQREVVLEAISLAAPELFGTAKDEAARKTKVAPALEALAARALASFPRPEAAELLANVGGAEGEGELLERYLNIASLAVPGRKDIYRRATAYDKSNLWRMHLALYIARRPALTEEQKGVVLDALSMATPELFGMPKDSPAWKTEARVNVEALTRRALGVFSKEEAATVFNRLGGKEPSSRLSKNAPARASFVPSGGPPQKPTCQCSHSSDWCAWTVCSGNICNRTEDGCGSFWLYPCDGTRCYEYNPAQ